MTKHFIKPLLTCCVLYIGCSHTAMPVHAPITENRKNVPATRQKEKNNLADYEKIPGFIKNISYKAKNGFEEYIIGPGDILQVSVWRKNRADRYEIKVRPDGKISLLFVADINVTGFTPTEVDNLLTERLKRFFKKPRIDVFIKEYHSKQVYLLGEVNTISGQAQSGPGKYMLKGKTTLLDLILSAGGLSKKADISEVELNRAGKTYKINLMDSIFKRDKDRQIVLENDDVILIQSLEETKYKEKTVYIMGEVKVPGIYKYTENIGTVKALAMAGGYTDNAIEADIKIIRGDIKNPVILSSNIKKYFKKGDLKQNIPIENGDILYVPHSAIKDINNFFKNIRPILETMLYPGLLRDLYTTGGGLRVNTGARGTGGTTILPSR